MPISAMKNSNNKPQEKILTQTIDLGLKYLEGVLVPCCRFCGQDMNPTHSLCV